MNLKSQLKMFSPDHQEEEVPEEICPNIWMRDESLLCKYGKRSSKPIMVIEGYTGADSDFKILAKELKTQLGVEGAVKNDTILTQGDHRDKIMILLKEKGFKVKRVGG